MVSFVQPVSGSTAVPRVREKLPTGLQLSREASRASKVSHYNVQDYTLIMLIMLPYMNSDSH